MDHHSSLTDTVAGVAGVAHGTCRLKLSESESDGTEQIIFSNPLSAKLITLVKPFQTQLDNQAEI
jgi:hypothetical protein